MANLPEGFKLDTMPEGFTLDEEKGYLRQTIENVPSSAKQFGQNIYQAVRHPIDTAGALAKAGGGMLESMQTETPPSSMPGNVEAFEAMKGFFSDRYGGLDKLSETIKTDPVGFAADMSILLTGAGGLASKAPGMVGKVGEITKTVGQAANPINLAMETATAVPRLASKVVGAVAPQTKGLPQRTAVGMIEKQLKPSTTLPSGTRQEIIKYMLDNGMNVTKGGLSKVENKLSANNKLFDDVINGAAKKGDMVNVDEIAKTLNRTRKTFGDSLFADDLLPHVDRAEELLRSHKNTSGSMMPIDKARAMKTDLHKALKGAYGELSNVTDEAMKDIVHGINEEIWKKFPVLKEAGQEMRVQIALERELERAVNRLGNNNAISLQDLGLGGGLGASSGSPALAVSAGLMNKVLRMPAIKGIIARQINQIGRKEFNARQSGAFKESAKNLSVLGRKDSSE